MTWGYNGPAVYAICNTVNGKVYIGSSSHYGRRRAQHVSRLSRDKSNQSLLQRSWKKYGAMAFEFHVLERPTIETLISREQFWMDELSPELNARKTASIGWPAATSEEIRKIRSLTWHRNPLRRIGPHSEATKAKIRATKAANPHVYTLEQRSKMSAAAAVRPHRPLSAETKAKIGAANRGRAMRAKVPSA